MKLGGIVFPSLYFLIPCSINGFFSNTTPYRRGSWRKNQVIAVADNDCNKVEGGREEAPSEQERVWKYLLERFQGDFDNYHQVVEDREQGLMPREGGGHENFHCTLIPVGERARLAAFYFDGNPERIFRFRYYEILNEESEKGQVEMRLYTLHPELELLLRSCSEEPETWPSLFTAYEPSDTSEKKLSYLPNCEVTWSCELDPEEHDYALSSPETDGVHAVMVHGEAIVDSTLIPGVKIRILDQLSLFEDTFYINDRGLNPDTGAFIYGNQIGVPYRLERVTNLVAGRQREVVNDDLKWTMGPKWRTEEEYKAKLEGMGGPSAQMSKGGPPSKPPK